MLDEADEPTGVMVAERPAGRPSPASSVASVTPPGRQSPAARRPWLRSLLFLLLPAALLFGCYRYVTGGRTMTTDDAYVDSDKVGISTDVSGVVSEVDVTENQSVGVGQVLYRLDDQPFRIALQRADGAVGMVADTLDSLKATYRDMQSQIRQAQNDADYFNTDYRRETGLLSAHVASQATVDLARRNLQNAQQKIVALDQQLGGIAANLDGDPLGTVAHNPRYLEAVAQRAEMARELAHTVVRAPFAGIVTNVPAIAVGTYLAAATTAFNLVATDHVWVTANPKETQLTYVHAGEAVTVTADTYPGIRWRGTLASISPAAAQEFSLLPAQNTSGNWIKVVQRIPVRVQVDTSDPSLPALRAGMSVEVGVDTGHTNGLPRFLAFLNGGGHRP